MGCCSPRCQQITMFTLAITLLGIGITMAIIWENLFISIRNKELSVGSTDTKGFKMWKETPIPMYMEFYLFNWTNADKFKDNTWPEKPHFEECGPYTYSEHHIREQIVFNENNKTITYKTRKIWKFLPEKSKGKLDDKITTINTILAAVGNTVKDKNIIVQEGIDFFIKEKSEQLILTKTVDEFIFKGYNDPFIKLAHKLHIKGLNIPFDKFGWFYDRNNSVDYDGTLNMFSGADDINKLGRLTSWNFKSQLDFYPGKCGVVRGTSGELWYPPLDSETVEVFSPDICSTVKIRKNSTVMHYGIEGQKYVATNEIFDYSLPENQCYQPEGMKMANGARNVGKCKFNAPAYVSFPHFLGADPSYYSGITGMKPDPAVHHFFLALEPNTGLPLKVHAALQVNILLHKVKGITCLKHIENTYFPMLWFKETAELTEELSSLGKMLLILPSVGTYTSYGLIAIGTLLFIIGFYLVLKKGWKTIHDEEQLLNQQQTFN